MFASQPLTPLIHDCVPTPDAALALMLSLSCVDYEVVGITTTSTPNTSHLAALNMRTITNLCGYDLPIYAGAQNPLRHNSSQTASAAYLIDKLAGHTAPPHILCATGPLTNIAAACIKQPSIIQNIQHLIIGGGCAFPEPIRGEMGAESNFAVDPEATAVVFDSDIKNISMIGLNVTRKILFNGRWRTRLRNLNNPVAHHAANILSRVTDAHAKDMGHLRAFANDPVRALHDAVAVIYMHHPELFSSHKMHIRIVTGSPPVIAGQSLPCNWGDRNASRYPVSVVTDVDADGVLEMICDGLASYHMPALPQPAYSLIL